MAFKPEEVCLGMCCYSLKAQFRRLGLWVCGDSQRRSATVGMYTSGRGPKKVHLTASIHIQYRHVLLACNEAITECTIIIQMTTRLQFTFLVLLGLSVIGNVTFEQCEGEFL